MAKLEGGCLCGAVRYSSAADPVMSAVCHRSHCQKQSGSSFSVILGVPKTALTITGTLKSFTDSTESGVPMARKFCGDCGSPILSDTPATPDLVYLKAGTLDDPSDLAPGAHIWVEHKQNWVALPEGVPAVGRGLSKS